jgi:hypothetical protein
VVALLETVVLVEVKPAAA